MSKLTGADVIKSYSRRSTSSLSTGAPYKISPPSTFVIEIGTRLTRIGIAGEHVPRFVFRTSYVDPFCLMRPIKLYDPKREICEQERILLSFFKDVTLGKLFKSPANSRFIFVDSLFSTSEFRNLLAKVLFKKALNVAAISFVPASLMHLITMNAETAILIDTGINECLLYPIFDRVVLFHEFDATPQSTAAIENHIRELMASHGRVQAIDGVERKLNKDDWDLFDKLRCAEDICHRFCFVTSRARSLQFQGDDTKDTLKCVPSVKIEFGFEKLVVPGIVRETAANVVFTPDIDLRSIPQLIVDFIGRASIEVKKQYLSSLLFVGGLSNMQGFLSRMREELEFLLDDYENGKYSALKNDIGFYQHPEPSATKFCSAWIGASLISPFDFNQWYTREQWDKSQNVPDWTFNIESYLSANAPDKSCKVYEYEPDMISFKNE